MAVIRDLDTASRASTAVAPPGGGTNPGRADCPAPATLTALTTIQRLLPRIRTDRTRARRRITRLVSPPPAGPRTPQIGVEVMAGALAAIAVVLALFGPAVLAVVVLAATAGRVAWRKRALALAERRRQALLPEALERMAAALRTGSSLPQALGEAARGTATPLGGELAGLAEQTTRGMPVLAVLDGWTARHPDRGTRLAAVALALATGVGAAPARALDGVATTLRERLELAGERHALATQARASAIVLSAAPPVFAALLALGDPEAGRFLLRTPVGWSCIAVGVGLDVAGGLWMSRLTRAGAA